MGFKLYRRHNCDRAHRTYLAMAKCIWRRAQNNIGGEGPYALVSCTGQRVTLWNDPEAVEGCRAALDQTHCGSGCRGAAHEVVELVLPGSAPARRIDPLCERPPAPPPPKPDPTLF